MRRSRGLLCALALVGCASQGGPRPPVQRTSRAEHEEPKPAWRRTCTEYARAPVAISYQDAPGGAAVLYRTPGDAQALRTRTEEVAQFHNGGAAKIPALHDLYHVPHRASVEPLDDGAMLVLVPKHPDVRDLDTLRRNVQQEVFNMQRKGCGRGQEAL